MGDDQERELAGDGINMVSRVLAICLFMVGPALLGAYLDKRLQTTWITVVGVVAGMAFGCVGLLLVLKVMDERSKKLPKPNYRKIESWNEPQEGVDEKDKLA